MKRNQLVFRKIWHPSRTWLKKWENHFAKEFGRPEAKSRIQFFRRRIAQKGWAVKQLRVIG